MQQLTAQNYEAEAKQQSMPVVVMFYAVWCGKCAMMKSVVEEMERKYQGRMKFCEVDVDEAPALAEKYGAGLVPTFVLIKNGRETGIMQGLIDEGVFEQRIRRLMKK